MNRDPLPKVAERVALWMEQQAARDEAQARGSARQFASLADALKADASNYRKMAADLRDAIASGTCRS